jgi:uncharacterized protein YegP (UPF0339 family)
MLILLQLVQFNEVGVKMSGQWKIYTDSQNKWCWYKTAKNGQMLGASKKSYETEAACVKNAQQSGMKEYSPRS